MSVSPRRGSGLQDRGVVRIGDTVRRPLGHWRPSVHALLSHLRRSGLEIVPEPLGVDDSGREVLRFLAGRDQGWPFLPEILTDEGAFELGRLATRLRSALATFPCPPDARWHSVAGAPSAGQSMQHGDLGPWNLLWAPSPSATVTGVIDWDLAEPGDPFYDTGFLAWFTVPFMDDTRAATRGFPSRPNRVARLLSFAQGAALNPAHVLRLGFAAQQEFATRVTTRPTEPWPTLHTMATHDSALSDMSWTRENLTLPPP